MNKEHKEFTAERRAVTICGNEYSLREMSLSEKLQFTKYLQNDDYITGAVFMAKKSVPDFPDWDTAGESETRDAVAACFELNDIRAFNENFSQQVRGKNHTPSPKQSSEPESTQSAS